MRDSGPIYHELHRPQFHFTPKDYWMNDPNGLVYYKGEYHLFFQYSPGFMNHAPNSWGHAVSTDLMHWQQIANGLEPDEYGWIWSGSGVVDHHNTTGFQVGEEEPIVLIYTTGGFGQPGNPCVQHIAYSNDRGRTFTRHAGNPVLGHLRAENRDPKVVWHEPTRQWVMALFLDEHDYALFGSPDMKTWSHRCDIVMENTGECPDLFRLPVDGERGNERWVFWGAAGVYRIGRFDGKTFVPETETIRAEYGANGYAAQTWSDLPAEDGRVVQISWMAGGKYPSMPFNQQLSFPVELALRTTREGIRLFRKPVAEIERLHTRKHEWQDYVLRSGPNRRALFVRHGPAWREQMSTEQANLIPPTTAELFDIRAEIEPGDAAAWGVLIQGNDLRYNVNEKRFVFLGREIPAEPDEDGRLRVQILVDRTSVELFVGGGRTSGSFCCLPSACDWPLEFYAREGSMRLVSLAVHELDSVWPQR